MLHVRHVLYILTSLLQYVLSVKCLRVRIINSDDLQMCTDLWPLKILEQLRGRVGNNELLY